MPKFNVESYLNSFPDDIEEINVNVKGLTYLPSLSRFTNLKILRCSYNKFVSLPLLPDSLQELHCSNNKLVTLPPLPNSLQVLWCLQNKLVSLPPLPNSLQKLHCGNNKLVSLPLLPNSLEQLFCYDNKLTSLPPLPNSLEELYCDSNKLVSLPPLPNLLRELLYVNNPIDDVLKPNNINVTKANVRILNNFRFLYHCIKYKNKLRKWLWKSRENKVKEEFHPDRIIELLEGKDIDDIDF